MMELGILKTWDSGNYRAGVQLTSSLTTYLDSLNVARNIPSAEMLVGRFVIVALPRENPRDAVVIAVFTI